MDYSDLALDMLSKHLGEPISLEDAGYESYSFEVVELDMTIIPMSYQSYLSRFQDVMTHLYLYKELVVYILYPLADSASDPKLVGLLYEDKLLDYRIITGGV
ncbi:MAG: hypothetical protein ACTH80_00530 [Alkalibacterium gilvum]|uniref:hypothetical protein n=1 Tax=Alkalibacterium gilvum TaxID=1130080 RepID=UPI003F928C88